MKQKNFFRYVLTLVAVCLMTIPAMAQNQQVKGTVIDENGEPVIGASVIVAGTKSTGTVTDIDGNYTISVPKGAKIKVTYIGYEPLTAVAGGTVQLKPSDNSLSEVVVVGYGQQKKAHLTGAVATVPVDEIQDLANGGLAQSLTGLVNGLSTGGASDNRAGGTTHIRIRDTGTIQNLKGTNNDDGNYDPLYVIDGFIYPQDLGNTAFNNLDPSTIENISVLKDAAAAVYGARAANGVIIVTTKRGKMGAPKISYSGTVGIADEIDRPKMLSAYEYGRLWNAVKAADPKNTTLNNRLDLFQADELAAMRSLNYDLLDKYWKTAVTHRHSINISGASERANYFANISYFNQGGNIGKLDYDRWNYRAGADVKLGKGFKASVQISGDYGTRTTPYVSVGGSGSQNDYRALLYHPYYIPEYVGENPIATKGVTNAAYGANSVPNYSFDVLQNNGDYSEDKTQNMTINGSLEYDFSNLWKPLKGLNAKFTYSKSISNTKNNQYASEYEIYSMKERFGSGSHLYTPVEGLNQWSLYDESNFTHQTISNGNSLSRNMSRYDNYQMNFTLNYSREIGKHHIAGLFSIEKSESEREDLMGRVTEPYEFTTGQSSSVKGTSEQSTTFGRSESGNLSYIGRVNYAYANRYLFEFLFRADSSQKFAPENRWGYFPSFSGGWVVSEEPFMKNVKWVDYLKVRASFGLTGRDNTSAWQWMQVYSTPSDKGAIFGTGTTIPSGAHITINDANASVNRDIHWDKSYKTNFGIDFHTLNSRLQIALDGYFENNREMLMSLASNVAAVVGTRSASQNLGRMDTYGIELGITWKDKIGKDFKYKVGVNTGWSDNKVYNMDFSNDYVYRQIQYGQRSDVGLWGMECIGMFRSYQDIEEYWAVLEQNAAAYKAKYGIDVTPSYMNMSKDQIKPGMLIYKDVRGDVNEDGQTYKDPDGRVNNDNDQIQISKRSSNPWGFTTNLSAEWKGISLTAQIRASWGAYECVPSSALKTSTGYDLEYQNMPSFWNVDDMYSYQDVYDASGNLVVAANRDALYPSLAYSNINSVASTFWKVSAARVQLSRLTIAYSIPKPWCNKIGVEGVRLNVTGQNVINFYNPYPDSFYSPMAGTYGNYPNLRKWTIGVNVSF